MSRRHTENETRRETISYRVTRSLYNKIVNFVNKSNEVSISDYARNALIERMKSEEGQENGKG